MSYSMLSKIASKFQKKSPDSMTDISPKKPSIRDLKISPRVSGNSFSLEFIQPQTPTSTNSIGSEDSFTFKSSTEMLSSEIYSRYPGKPNPIYGSSDRSNTFSHSYSSSEQRKKMGKRKNIMRQNCCICKESLVTMMDGEKPIQCECGHCSHEHCFTYLVKSNFNNSNPNSNPSSYLNSNHILPHCPDCGNETSLVPVNSEFFEEIMTKVLTNKSNVFGGHDHTTHYDPERLNNLLSSKKTSTTPLLPDLHNGEIPSSTHSYSFSFQREKQQIQRSFTSPIPNIKDRRYKFTNTETPIKVHGVETEKEVVYQDINSLPPPVLSFQSLRTKNLSDDSLSLIGSQKIKKLRENVRKALLDGIEDWYELDTNLFQELRLIDILKVGETIDEFQTLICVLFTNSLLMIEPLNKNLSESCTTNDKASYHIKGVAMIDKEGMSVTVPIGHEDVIQLKINSPFLPELYLSSKVDSVLQRWSLALRYQGQKFEYYETTATLDIDTLERYGTPKSPMNFLESGSKSIISKTPDASSNNVVANSQNLINTNEKVYYFYINHSYTPSDSLIVSNNIRAILTQLKENDLLSVTLSTGRRHDGSNANVYYQQAPIKSNDLGWETLLQKIGDKSSMKQKLQPFSDVMSSIFENKNENNNNSFNFIISNFGAISKFYNKLQTTKLNNTYVIQVGFDDSNIGIDGKISPPSIMSPDNLYLVGEWTRVLEYIIDITGLPFGDQTSEEENISDEDSESDFEFDEENDLEETVIYLPSFDREIIKPLATEELRMPPRINRKVNLNINSGRISSLLNSRLSYDYKTRSIIQPNSANKSDCSSMMLQVGLDIK